MALLMRCSTAMLPFLVRQVFGGRDFDKIYSWMISVFNGIGALGATGWALVAEGFGWHGFFIGGIIVLTITFGLLGYTCTLATKHAARLGSSPMPSLLLRLIKPWKALNRSAYTCIHLAMLNREGRGILLLPFVSIEERFMAKDQTNPDCCSTEGRSSNFLFVYSILLCS